LYIALVCVSMSLSMIVNWFMFVLYIDMFHFLKQCCCVELEECICMYLGLLRRPGCRCQDDVNMHDTEVEWDSMD